MKIDLRGFRLSGSCLRLRQTASSTRPQSTSLPSSSCWQDWLKPMRKSTTRSPLHKGGYERCVAGACWR
ncbi:hypothetical protein CF130_16680 [Aeromonas dhakensis]|nr:hypothetical protein CF130_16680 [Aeromonas dhakensis]